MAFDPSYAAPSGARTFFERRELDQLLRLCKSCKHFARPLDRAKLIPRALQK